MWLTRTRYQKSNSKSTKYRGKLYPAIVCRKGRKAQRKNSKKKLGFFFGLSIFSSPVNAILKTKTVAVVVAPPGNPTDTTNGRDQHKYKDWISTTTYRGIVLVLNHVRKKGKKEKKGRDIFISNMVSNKLLGSQV